MSNTIPLSHLALEIAASADELAARLGDRVCVDDIGRRAVDRDLAAVMIAAHGADVEAKRERTEAVRRQRAARIAAAAERNRQQRELQRAALERQPRIEGVDLPAAALAAITAGDQQNKLARASRHADELLRQRPGTYTYHSVVREEH